MKRRTAWACGALLLLAACGNAGPGNDPTPVTGEPAALGDPIAGLTADELEAFGRGRAVFERRFKPSEGLGPLYNATSCVSCHSTPVTGGAAKLYRNFFLVRRGDPAVPGGQTDLPDLPSPVIPAFGPRGAHSTATFSLQAGRALIPHGGLPGESVQVAHRNSLPIFGVGLFEFISDETIIANTDPDDADGDGISGRFNTDRGAIGRFGVKAQSNNIEVFTRPPLMNQMGITSSPFRGEGSIVRRGRQVSGDPTDSNQDADGVPDPEISNADLGDLIAFTTFLAAPIPKPFDDAARRGEALFESLGCVKCHIPSLPSSRGPVNAFTDLLLHEMGPELADGISLGVPQPSNLSDPTPHLEFRTQPLWGVSHSGPWLHDGRAETLMEAITMHGGEAAAIRDAFNALTPSEQADVITFLEHL
jgi:CxxC motif-containing protein (DUF1111 family)